MSKTPNTSKQWRVQYRRSRAHKWHNAGLYETRERAREEATYYREQLTIDGVDAYFGYGNTRVIPYVKGGAK